MLAVFTRLFSRRTWLETLYAVSSVLVAGTADAAVLICLSVSAGLVIVFIGLPGLVLSLRLASLVGEFERYRVAALLGAHIPDPRPELSSRPASALSDLVSWKAAAHAFLSMPLGALACGIALASWALALGLTALPAYAWAVPDSVWNTIDVTRSPALVAGLTIAGLVMLVVGAPLVVSAVTAVQRRMAFALLGPSRADALQERVDHLFETRERSVDAAAAERRRIERDLHDGAQQRLVSLAMDLGMAREKFDNDPTAARRLVEEAHQEAKRALVELRDLARGIHPSVLAQDGLDAALSSLVSRSTVPVEVNVDVPARPSERVEAVAYFIVAEALTNIARHAHAKRAVVSVVRRGDSLIVEVRDDGVGGADATRGSGLAGLGDRVAALDGEFRVRSPAGGPTSVVAELPCDS